MPFKSVAQQHFLEANPDKVGGREKLKEWEQATDFKSLPRKAPGFGRRKTKENA
jgi:hypothetical protein